MSPSDVMQIIKSISAREFFRRYPEIKKRYFWGGKLWTQSYFVETIGNANEEAIRAYVQGQLRAREERKYTTTARFVLKLGSLATEFFISYLSTKPSYHLL